MEHCYNDNGEGNEVLWENPSQCHFAYTKSYINGLSIENKSILKSNYISLYLNVYFWGRRNIQNAYL
jgi:hypothetical protein